MDNKRKIGKEYEAKAGEFLKSQGMKIIQYNYICKVSEIDIIAKDGDYLVFCEVKYRGGTKYGNSLDAVNIAKQKKIRIGAKWYITEHHLCEDTYIRFDVIGIDKEKITHIKDAF